MSDGMIITLSIIGVSLFVILIIFIVVKSSKNHMKKILETISPIWVEFIDILVLQISTGEGTLIAYYPVFKNKKDNKIYITSRFGNYGYFQPTTEGYFTDNPKIVYKNIKKEIVEFNKEGRLYIEKEKDTIKVENETIIIEGRKVSYAGKYQKTLKLNHIYNISNDNILEIINGAVIFNGIADFDMEGVLREYIS